MGSFTIKKGAIERITKSIVAHASVVDRGLESKMNDIITIIYKTARARRPKITGQQSKASGRQYFRKVDGKRREYRVSDPNAKLGVPVDTGRLQASITKKLFKRGGKYIGQIEAGVGLPYAAAIEFGTSKMAARPFMRPAINENMPYIRKRFKEKIQFGDIK